MSKAFLFPGQGCQKEKMGKDLYENSPKARDIFEQANDILGERFSDTLFNASEEFLMDTRYTQPAIFIYEVALALGQDEVRPDCVAGHSLGEYAALVTSGVLSFEEALKYAEKYKKQTGQNVRIENLGSVEELYQYEKQRKKSESLIDKLKRKEVYYDFIEVMNCIGGCLAGGGQPKMTLLDMDDTKKSPKLK